MLNRFSHSHNTCSFLTHSNPIKEDFSCMDRAVQGVLLQNETLLPSIVLYFKDLGRFFGCRSIDHVLDSNT
jgi:hypothetical protein